MSKAVLIICLVGLGISTISLVVSMIQLAYWQRKKRKTLNDLMVLWAEAEAREKDTKEYEETDGVIKIKKQSGSDVEEIKHIVVCSPNYTRFFYNDSMPTPQAAIEAIEKAFCNPCKERGDDYNEVRCRACNFDDAISQIDALLPVESERPNGEWIVKEHCSNENGFKKWVEIRCPFCGHKPVYENMDDMEFCPKCGADMRGG